MGMRRKENLLCDITEEEVAAAATQAAEKQKLVDDLTEKRRADAASLKQQIDALTKQVREHLAEVRTRQGYRDVDLEDEIRGDHVVTTRCDTGEVFNRYLATDDDRQDLLFDVVTSDQQDAIDSASAGA